MVCGPLKAFWEVHSSGPGQTFVTNNCGKWFGSVHELGGVESQRFTMVVQVVLDRLMETKILWVGESLKKRDNGIYQHFYLKLPAVWGKGSTKKQ